MNLNEDSPPSSSVLIDDLSEDVFAQVKLASMNDEDVSEINDDCANAEYAQAMSQRVCKKAGLK